MILAREKYEIEIYRSTIPDSITLALYVWKGDKNTVPSAAVYSVTKDNLEGLSTPDYIDIASLSSDYIDNIQNSFNTGLNNYNDCVWVKYEVYLNNEETPNQEDVLLAVNGYFTIDKQILLDGSELSMYDEYIVPFKVGNTITVQSYPNSEINTSYANVSSNLSNEQLKHILIKRPATDKYIKVSNGTEEVYIYIEELTRYKTNNVTFVNSFGCVQLIPFLNERNDSLKVEGSTFRVGVSSSNHKYIDYNKNGRQDLKLKSGFHEEEANEAFESLLLSECLYVQNIPCNITSKSIAYKNRLNDKLIEYTLNFSESFDKLNTY